MTIISQLAQPVTVRTITNGPADDYGVPTEVVVTAPAQMAIMQTDSVEITVGEQTVISNWAAYSDDPDLPLTARDEIVDAAGAVYKVVGKPYRPPTPRGRHHVEARLRLLE